MTGHTPEPWRHGINAMIVADGLPVADCAPDWCEDDTPEPNARRIVACVNACRGIPTEALERPFCANQISQHSWVLRAIPLPPPEDT